MIKFAGLIISVICLSVVQITLAGQKEWNEVADTVCKKVYDLKIDLTKVVDYTLFPGAYGIAKRENGEVHIFADNKCFRHDPKTSGSCQQTKVNWYIENDKMHLTHTNVYKGIESYYCSVDE